MCETPPIRVVAGPNGGRSGAGRRQVSISPDASMSSRDI
jgi:hypothetical protein